MGVGAAHFNDRAFWNAHESWEEAWHILRGQDNDSATEFVHGMILATAAFENAVRGKERGFKRQLASALHILRARRGAGTGLGVENEHAWTEALVDAYLAACRELRWTTWRGSGWVAPRLIVRA